MTARAAALITIYLAAITAANLITTHYARIGHPEASIYTAFALVALDLVIRDALHDWYTGRRRIIILAGLIAAGSTLSYLANPDSAEIAKWSALAFAAAMTVDGIVYQALRHLPWAERSNASNIAGAIVDSTVFCAGLGFPFIVAFGQLTAKIAGGVLFVLLLERVVPVGTYLRRA
jgi:uncharacterized PurR-regulated membrane protein YhhQ (DUF165 family)